MEQAATYLLTVKKLKSLKEKIAGPICLGNISKDWSVDNMNKTGFTGYVYDFSVDHDPTAVDDIENIPKYLMKKNNTL